MSKCAKLVTALLSTIICGICLLTLIKNLWIEISDNQTEVDYWLEQNDLKKYKQVFRERGESNGVNSLRNVIFLTFHRLRIFMIS